MPTLLDFWMTFGHRQRTCGCASRMVEPVMVIEARRGVAEVLGVISGRSHRHRRR